MYSLITHLFISTKTYTELHRKDAPVATTSDERANVDAAVEEEHHQGFLYNIRKHPHAVGWSILLSTAVIMEGFDIVLINSLLAVDEFQRTFGRQLPDGSYELSAAWQAGLTNGAIVGEILGLMLNGIIADRFGFKKTMIGALTAITGLIFIPFFSTSPVQLLVGLILMG